MTTDNHYYHNQDKLWTQLQWYTIKFNAVHHSLIVQNKSAGAVDKIILFCTVYLEREDSG